MKKLAASGLIAFTRKHLRDKNNGEKRIGLRAAVNRKCNDCMVDPLDHGTAAQQIACCTSSDCPLHRVRPITATKIPHRLLALWHISTDQLCDRASLLVEKELSPVEARNGAVASAESMSAPYVSSCDDNQQ